jgi:D-alanine-D-alanine ligase
MSRLALTGHEFRRVEDPAAFGKVAVLYGGRSSEREVSLMSGRAVLEALQSRGVNAEGVDPAQSAVGELPGAGFDRAWIALHGPGGEDGALQGALEWLGLPYTGSGVLGSAVGMDKLRTKQLAMACGVATPEYRVVTSLADCEAAARELGLPLAIKPASQGSSVGMSRVEELAQLAGAWVSASTHDPVVIAEPWIRGEELTVPILQGEALPAIRIETPRAFYDYEAKYFADDTRYHIPCGLGAQVEAKVAAAALAAFRAIGAQGWGRVDFMLGAGAVPLLLEVNTVPGMTSHSLVPMAAKARGIDFPELCWRVLETSFAREDRP